MGSPPWITLWVLESKNADAGGTTLGKGIWDSTEGMNKDSSMEENFSVEVFRSDVRKAGQPIFKGDAEPIQINLIFQWSCKSKLSWWEQELFLNNSTSYLEREIKRSIDHGKLVKNWSIYFHF